MRPVARYITLAGLMCASCDVGGDRKPQASGSTDQPSRPAPTKYEATDPRTQRALDTAFAYVAAYAREHGQTECEAAKLARESGRLDVRIVRDHWGTLIDFRCDGERVEFRSAGPDRRFGTKDDQLSPVPGSAHEQLWRYPPLPSARPTAPPSARSDQ